MQPSSAAQGHDSEGRGVRDSEDCTLAVLNAAAEVLGIQADEARGLSHHELMSFGGVVLTEQEAFDTRERLWEELLTERFPIEMVENPVYFRATFTRPVRSTWDAAGELGEDDILITKKERTLFNFVARIFFRRGELDAPYQRAVTGIMSDTTDCLQRVSQKRARVLCRSPEYNKLLRWVRVCLGISTQHAAVAATTTAALVQDIKDHVLGAKTQQDRTAPGLRYKVRVADVVARAGTEPPPRRSERKRKRRDAYEESA